MRRVEIGHPKVWVVLMNVKRQLVKLGCRSRSLIWSVLLYFCGSSTEAQRQVETTWDERIGIDWFWIRQKQKRDRVRSLSHHLMPFS